MREPQITDLRELRCEPYLVNMLPNCDVFCRVDGDLRWVELVSLNENELDTLERSVNRGTMSKAARKLVWEGLYREERHESLRPFWEWFASLPNVESATTKPQSR